MNIIDLGAAPGGWSQRCTPDYRKKDKIIALDILPMEPIEGVDFIQGDFREQARVGSLYAVLDGALINL